MQNHHMHNHLMHNRSIALLAAASSLGVALALGAPLAAAAHVSIDPDTAEAGSFALVTFRVPNESATAGTTRIEVDLPTDTPFTSVRYVPVPGWTTELVTTTLPAPVDVGGNELTEAVTSVVWTAEAGEEIGDGQLQQFQLSLGPVPDTGSVVLPATQTYSDGEVVQWSETTETGENPAPVLLISDQPAGHGHSTAVSDDENASDGGSDNASPDDGEGNSSDDVLARALGIAGLVVGSVGITLAVTRRRSAV